MDFHGSELPTRAGDAATVAQRRLACSRKARPFVLGETQVVVGTCTRARVRVYPSVECKDLTKVISSFRSLFLLFLFLFLFVLLLLLLLLLLLFLLLLLLLLLRPFLGLSATTDENFPSSSQQ